MGTALSLIACVAGIVCVIGIGVYLVLNDHLWVGVLVILLGGSISVKIGS